MWAVGLEEIETYTPRRQSTAAQYIAMWIIIDLCLGEEQGQRSQGTKRWWEHDVLDISVLREVDEGGRDREGGVGGCIWGM